MKLQIITENSMYLKLGNGVTRISDYSRPQALDDFEVNIIDLSCEEIWRFAGYELNRVDYSAELESLSRMINASNNANIVIVFPQNLICRYGYHEGLGYKMSNTVREIVNKYNGIIRIINLSVINQPEAKIMFEPTKTTILGNEVEADFHFTDTYKKITVTESDISCKATTIKYRNRIWFTTLNLFDIKNYMVEYFVEYLFPSKVEEAPDWVKYYNFGTDYEEKEIIKDSELKIQEHQKRIDEANNRINENLKYKSILYTNGEKLVKVVFEILEKIFECDLSTFTDEKKEDFLIEKEREVFIGEIKGVNTNVKNEYISQLDVHCQTYNDAVQETKAIEKKIYGLLIINPFRMKPLKEREPINEKQIQLAERNNSLIIETETLLYVFDLFQKGELLADSIIETIRQKTGLLRKTDFNKSDVIN